ncbi:GntR family transcriptional regulator [Alteribacillus sp. HJP-4]|uniref:GntR family transcriptional regulator n=1 Tax=Alteribacillus sp. HJP-4 TaxID=2775394 RepID=UPI0035CCEC3F
MSQLYKKIYLNILEDIKSGALKSGDKIPSENELADKFNVSRITTKKALNMLAQRNLIERYRGKGSFVAQLDPEVLNITENAEAAVSPTSAQKLVGFVLPSFGEVYGSRLLESIEERCSDHNLSMIMKQTHGKLEEEDKAIKSLTNVGAKGLIFFPSPGKHYNNELLRLVVDNFPLVLVDRYLKGIPSSSVCINNKAASTKLTRHLIELGHEHIAFISPPVEGTSSVEDRLMGFHLAMSEKGFKTNPDIIFNNAVSSIDINKNDPAPLHSTDDIEEIRKLIEENPYITAFVACEYGIAVKLYQEIQRIGKRVPEDYSIVCFDSPKNLMSPPFFTHIQQNEKAIGYKAVDLLAAQLEGEKEPVHSDAEYKLIDGQSTSNSLANI